MKRTLLSSLIAVGVLFSSAIAFAVPVTLPTGPDDVVMIKYTNYEKVIQGTNTDNNPFAIDAGDRIIGILNVASVSNLDFSNVTFSANNTTELTGAFSISVVGGSIPISTPSLGGHIDFALNSGDYFNFYFDNSKDFNAKALNSTARATDGLLWLSILGDDYVKGYADATTGDVSTYNKNWANSTINNTGYTFSNELWPLLIGQISPASLLSEFYFEGKVNDLVAAGDYLEGWTFLSQDPFYAKVVPEPSTIILLGAGLLGLAGFARRRSR